MLLAVSQSLADVNTAATYAPDERLLKLVAPFRVAAGDSLARPSGLPEAQEPDPVKPRLGQVVQFRIRNVVQRDGATEFVGKLCRPDPGFDLVQQWIGSRSHCLLA